MQKNLFVGLCLIVLCLVVIFLMSKSVKEDFNCSSCGRNNWRVGPVRCLSCSNCGWCEKQDGSGSCKIARPGGYGPLFSEDCHRWYQGSGRSVHYNYYPWYNPVGWFYRAFPMRRRRYRVLRRRPRWTFL
tara:strand:- start:30 stop:419 length:390 start_codon:yes stop_codon:yes gene_type:complete